MMFCSYPLVGMSHMLMRITLSGRSKMPYLVMPLSSFWREQDVYDVVHVTGRAIYHV